MNSIILYTDGAARGNPGPGGYGAILLYGNRQKKLSQGFAHTTNNRMELWAVIAGLEAVKNPTIPITIYSDSKYVVDSISKGWVNKWIKTNFKGGKKNADLWTRYFNLAQQFSINIVWVKGHANNVYNNQCDELATAAADGTNLIKDEGYLA